MIEARRATIPEHDFAAHEHRELGPGIDRIHDVGARRQTNAELSAGALEVLHWVHDVLEPHIEWEDRWLYPEISRRAGTPWATRLMSFEHHQIRDAAGALATARTRLLGKPTDSDAIEVRGRMFALEALLRAHVAREERYLIPLLDGDLVPAPPAG